MSNSITYTLRHINTTGLFDFDYTWSGILKKTKKILKKEYDWSSSSSSSSDDDKKKKKKKKKSSKKDAKKRKMTREASKKVQENPFVAAILYHYIRLKFVTLDIVQKATYN